MSPDLPVGVSRDGRYFVDAAGAPAFFLGDTQWELFRAFRVADARRLLDRRRQQGFTAVMVMLLGVGASGNEDGRCDGTYPNTEGVRPWKDDNPLTPNEGYFAGVDRVVEHAARIGLCLVIGIYHARAGRANPIQLSNARGWAAWVGRRYRDAANIIWSMYPRSEPGALPMARELARGLAEGDGGRHLVSLHPDPSPASSSLFHREGWLDLNMIQTYKFVERLVPLITVDRARRPAKPVIMAEGAYEAGIEYGFPITPLWVRRQAYYSYLAGASHGYGHNDCWRGWSTWERALEAPGALQLAFLRRVITERREWWKLVPDPGLITEGGWQVGDVLTMAARHPRGAWLLVYLAHPFEAVLSVAPLRERAGARAFWMDPRTGDRAAVPLASDARTLELRVPQGWEDGLLVVEEADP